KSYLCRCEDLSIFAASDLTVLYGSKVGLSRIRFHIHDRIFGPIRRRMFAHPAGADDAESLLVRFEIVSRDVALTPEDPAFRASYGSRLRRAPPAPPHFPARADTGNLTLSQRERVLATTHSKSKGPTITDTRQILKIISSAGSKCKFQRFSKNDCGTVKFCRFTLFHGIASFGGLHAHTCTGVQKTGSVRPFIHTLKSRASKTTSFQMLSPASHSSVFCPATSEAPGRSP